MEQSSEPIAVPVIPVASAVSERPWRFHWTLPVGIAVAISLVAFAGYQIGARWTYASLDKGTESEEGVIWTCAMHPQIKMPQPGNCPICFMALTKTKLEEKLKRELTMTPEAIALAEIQTAPVRRQYITHVLRMVGKVDHDERRLASITAWAPGRIERLFVDYTGVTVRKGDHMVTLYSPELALVQKELLQSMRAAERSGDRDNLAASTVKLAEEKLRLLGLLPEQIDEIKRTGTPSEHVTIHAPASGVVVEKNAKQGMYVETGTPIYTIANYDQVWVLLDAYETDVPWLRYGQEVEFTTESYPGEIFKGRVAFIDPLLNEKTRTARVRVNVPNPKLRLKPGMFVHSQLKSRLAEGGLMIEPELAGKWISPMHPEIMKDGPGKCDICGMDLVKAEDLGFVAPRSETSAPLAIPATAPLVTGKRALVYIRKPDDPKAKVQQPIFEGREVLLGPRAGDYYLVRAGLEAGEQIVVHGAFKIDADLQIRGGISMMNPEGDAPSGGHQHGHADPGPTAKTDTNGHAGHSAAPLEVPASFRAVLDGVYASYLRVADALADDDLTAARSAIDAFVAAVKKVEPDELDDDSQKHWKTSARRLTIVAMEARDAKDRDATRRHFQTLSGEMIGLVQAFGHALAKPVYQYHCPMALDNRGAAWLQQGDGVRNPYSGLKMLTCGDRKATFYPQGPIAAPPQFLATLDPLYEAYLELHKALAADKLGDAAAAATKLQDVLAKIDPKPLDDRGKSTWQVASERMRPELARDWSKMDAKLMRERFEPIAAAMLMTADNFGHARRGPEPLTKAFCPMAFEGARPNEGAFWLQLGGQISNPFRPDMPVCGAIKRTFAGRSSK